MRPIEKESGFPGADIAIAIDKYVFAFGGSERVFHLQPGGVHVRHVVAIGLKLRSGIHLGAPEFLSDGQTAYSRWGRRQDLAVCSNQLKALLTRAWTSHRCAQLAHLLGTHNNNASLGAIFMTSTAASSAGLTASYSVDQVNSLIAGQPVLTIGDPELEALFWTMHPRYKFFKSLPLNAKMLDIGANDGGLHVWRDWGLPVRRDLEMYGIDLQRGQWADQYAGWEIVNLDESLPIFPGVRFDAFYATHLIEHIQDLDRLLAYIRGAAANNAQVFFEWPAPRTLTYPSANELRKQGFDIQTFNFFDDGTHLHTFSNAEVQKRLERNGFAVTEIGEIDMGLIAREYAVRGRLNGNPVWRQIGLWSATGWCNYVCARLVS